MRPADFYDFSLIFRHLSPNPFGLVKISPSPMDPNAVKNIVRLNMRNIIGLKWTQRRIFARSHTRICKIRSKIMNGRMQKKFSDLNNNSSLDLPGREK